MVSVCIQATEGMQQASRTHRCRACSSHCYRWCCTLKVGPACWGCQSLPPTQQRCYSPQSLAVPAGKSTFIRRGGPAPELPPGLLEDVVPEPEDINQVVQVSMPAAVCICFCGL